ncbi:hypothetical protein [Croceibacter atlanticus]|uniref:hypothetical protein n=1 Tax=Croceibacter atlanticus TaxID=313588 RepID=UPI0030F72CDC
MGRIIQTTLQFCLLLIISSSTIQAQQLAKEWPEESVHLTSNSQTFLAGEKLLYSCVLTNNNETSNLSKVLYVELFDETNTSIFKHKLQVANGKANSDYFIPTSLSTGHYKLVAYTMLSQYNAKQPFAEKDVYVINTFKTYNKPERSTATIAYDSVVKGSKTSVVSIETSTSTLNKRDELTINVMPKQDDILFASLSVREVLPIKVNEDTNADNIQPITNYNAIPELRGEIISGTVSGPSGNLQDVNVSLSMPGEDFINLQAITNTSGKFYFVLNAPYKSQNAVVSINEASFPNASINLDDKAFKFKNQLNYNTVSVSETVNSWLLQKSIDLQIENAFYEAKKDTIIEPKFSDKFYEPLGETFVLDEYTRFGTVRETFIEVINLAGFRKTDDGYNLLVYNYDNEDETVSQSEEPPLILIDGFKQYNTKALINLDPYTIENITIVPEQYRRGSQIYNGVVSVVTKEKDFYPNTLDASAKEITLQALEYDKSYFTPNYKENSEKNIPDFRAQLFWKPSILLKPTTFKVVTADKTGRYEINVSGLLKNGEAFENVIYIEVQE